jgi:hypothetical protein
MLIRVICTALAVLSLSVAAQAQGEQTLEQALASIDFASANVGVANAKAGSPSASSFYEVFSGFRLASVEGCTVTLRNEGKNRRGKYIYEVVLPLADLSDATKVSQSYASGGAGAPQDEFYPWLMFFDVKGQRRSITLNDRVRRRVMARGAHVSFSLRERQAAEKFAEGVQHAIRTCSRRGTPER